MRGTSSDRNDFYSTEERFQISSNILRKYHDETETKKIDYIDKALGMVDRITEVTKKIEETTTVKFADYPGGSKILDISDNAE